MTKKTAAFIFDQITTYLHSKELLEHCRLSANFFTRNRCLPFVVLVSYIINFIRRSLQFEISASAGFIGLKDVSKQAFSQARRKLSPMVFVLLNRKLITEFYSNNTFKTFRGFRLLAVDGSTLRLPKSEELRSEFGVYPKDGDISLIRTSVLYDVLNNLTLHATLTPYYGGSEKEMAIEHFEELSLLDCETKGNDCKDLLIFDRGYPSHFLMFFLRSKGKHFLVRAYESSISEVNDAVKSGVHDAIVDITLTTRKLYRKPDFDKHLPTLENKIIRVRVLTFELSSGQKEILITSLIDQNEFTYDDIFQVYAKRWNIEEHYKFCKCIAEIENFSGQSKIAMEQDFHGAIFACNIAALLAQEVQEELELAAANKKNKFKYKVNRNILIGAIKNEILEVLLGDQDLVAYCEKLKERIKRGAVPIKPDRSNPRHAPYRKQRSPIHKNCT
jgi:hypothetical protein